MLLWNDPSIVPLEEASREPSRDLREPKKPPDPREQTDPTWRAGPLTSGGNCEPNDPTVDRGNTGPAGAPIWRDSAPIWDSAAFWNYGDDDAPSPFRIDRASIRRHSSDDGADGLVPLKFYSEHE